jgi:cell division protein FtsB
MTDTRKRRRGATMLLAGLGAVVVLTLVFLGPGSFRVWSSQRSQTHALNEKIEALDRANARLRTRAAQLNDPESIRELARRDYGMVPKGSKAFAILPAPKPDTRPAGTWPFVTLAPTGDGPASGAAPTTVPSGD